MKGITIVLALWTFSLFAGNDKELAHTNNTKIDIEAEYKAAFKSEQFKFPELSVDLYKLYLGIKIDSFFKARSINGNILVAKDGQVIYKKSDGYANLSEYKPLDFNSTFQLASTSKPFTAVSIMQLVEKGKINIEDTIQTYIPEFPYKNITVKHLLCHRSGLPDYVKFAALYVKEDAPFDNEDLITLLVNKKPKLLAMPDDRFDYCNTNYALLTSIVERVSGMKFEDYLKKNIFDPLEMKNSYAFRKGITPWKPNQTQGYESNGRIRYHDFMDGVLGDKGVYSTVDDMLKFDQSFYNFKILKPETIKMMTTTQTWENSTKGYALGFRTVTMSDYSRGIYHNGWWKGYSNAFFRVPEKGITVIILCNKYNSGVYKCATPLVSLMLNTPELPEMEMGGSE